MMSLRENIDGIKEAIAAVNIAVEERKDKGKFRYGICLLYVVICIK